MTTANHRGKTAGDQVEVQTLRLRYRKRGSSSSQDENNLAAERGTAYMRNTGSSSFSHRGETRRWRTDKVELWVLTASATLQETAGVLENEEMILTGIHDVLAKVTEASNAGVEVFE